jgi:hypothetical protein
VAAVPQLTCPEAATADATQRLTRSSPHTGPGHTIPGQTILTILTILTARPGR